MSLSLAIVMEPLNGIKEDNRWPRDIIKKKKFHTYVQIIRLKTNGAYLVPIKIPSKYLTM
jgi:hypothetical protein